jgi:hypothetical protein
MSNEIEEVQNVRVTKYRNGKMGVLIAKQGQLPGKSTQTSLQLGSQPAQKVVNPTPGPSGSVAAESAVASAQSAPSLPKPSVISQAGINSAQTKAEESRIKKEKILAGETGRSLPTIGNKNRNAFGKALTNMPEALEAGRVNRVKKENQRQANLLKKVEGITPKSNAKSTAKRSGTTTNTLRQLAEATAVNARAKSVAEHTPTTKPTLNPPGQGYVNKQQGGRRKRSHKRSHKRARRTQRARRTRR